MEANEHQAACLAACVAYHKATDAFETVRDAYRARHVGDAEFCEAVAVRDAASDARDAAYQAAADAGVEFYVSDADLAAAGYVRRIPAPPPKQPRKPKTPQVAW